MGKQEVEAGRSERTEDEKLYCQELERQVEELRNLNEEHVRLNNIEKFAAAGRMARTIAHEVRNPLTNISLALEQLNAEMPQNDETVLLIDMINRNTMRINQMITDLLNSTKFAQLTFSRTSVNDVLHNAIAGVKTLASQRGITISAQLSDELPPLTVDAEKLQVAFENIMNSAIETVHHADGNIHITTALENDKCLITLQDNGEGISEEKLQRLFEPYFASKLSSSGLALTYAQNVILNHGGNICADSQPGKGTCFTIVLQLS